MEYTKTEHKAIDNIHQWVGNFGFFPGSVGHGTAQYLYHLVLETKPELVVEIGCYLGFSTLHLAKGLRENDRGRLVSFDLKTGWASCTIHEAGLSDHVEFVQGYSDVMSRAYLTHSGQKIDILFVDGDHTSRGCVRDFNTLHGHMRNGGYVIFHDIYPKMCGWKGPRLVLDCLKAAKRPLAQFDIRERTDLDPFGVAVCRMISPGRNPLVACSWMRKMDLWVKTSKVMKLIELMIFEAKLPASHRNFLRRMGTLSKEIFHSRILPKL